MSFSEFQNSARLYVIGALDPDEMADFEVARKEFGQKGEDYIGECYALHEAFALSLQHGVENHFATAIKVAVRVKGLEGVATSAYVTPKLHLQGPGKKKPYHTSFLHNLFTSPLMTLFIALPSAALVAIAVIAFASGWTRGTLRKRMAEFVSMPVPEKDSPSGALADKIEGGTEKMFERTDWWGRFVAYLTLADISTPPERIVLFTFIGTFLTIWLLSVIIHSVLIALLMPARSGARQRRVSSCVIQPQTVTAASAMPGSVSHGP